MRLILCVEANYAVMQVMTINILHGRLPLFDVKACDILGKKDSDQALNPEKFRLHLFW